MKGERFGSSKVFGFTLDFATVDAFCAGLGDDGSYRDETGDLSVCRRKEQRWWWIGRGVGVIAKIAATAHENVINTHTRAIFLCGGPGNKVRDNGVVEQSVDVANQVFDRARFHKGAVESLQLDGFA